MANCLSVNEDANISARLQQLYENIEQERSLLNNLVVRNNNFNDDILFHHMRKIDSLVVEYTRLKSKCSSPIAGEDILGEFE
ncbi:MAG: hypothetical protein P4N59_13730 [Negativicutes bacterium]|nr:hypothetical protein [Negativicutes bacterium]